MGFGETEFNLAREVDSSVDAVARDLYLDTAGGERKAEIRVAEEEADKENGEEKDEAAGDIFGCAALRSRFRDGVADADRVAIKVTNEGG